MSAPGVTNCGQALPDGEANARLIAAAPDLLEAARSAERDLAAIYEAIARVGGPEMSLGQFLRLEALRAAIAKATIGE